MNETRTVPSGTQITELATSVASARYLREKAPDAYILNMVREMLATGADTLTLIASRVTLPDEKKAA